MRSKKSSLPEQVSLPWHPPGLVAGVDPLSNKAMLEALGDDA